MYLGSPAAATWLTSEARDVDRLVAWQREWIDWRPLASRQSGSSPGLTVLADPGTRPP